MVAKQTTKHSNEHSSEQTNELPLTGKVALVTGGSRGIGQCIVETFLAHGARVVTCGRGKPPDYIFSTLASPTADASDPSSAKWVNCDVSDSASVEAMLGDITRQFGSLSVLVNNAGVQVEKTVLDSSDDDWDLVMGANAKGVFNCCRAAIPNMSKGASIINIGSISGRVADPGMALYNASKAFVHGLTRSIAVDHGASVRCNAILPGWIMTGMADAAFAQANDPAMAKSDAIARHPVGRFGQPADIANMALWLASDASSFANGQCFTVDGGMTSASPLNPGLY